MDDSGLLPLGAFLADQRLLAGEMVLVVRGRL